MNFKFLIFSFLICACSPNFSAQSNKIPYASKGFAYIYNDRDFSDKIIKNKMDNSQLQIAHSNLRVGSLIKVTNPKTYNSLVLKNYKRIKYPNFYKILITKAVAEELNLNEKLPLVEILEIKKNKSFIAKKAKIFQEEKKISSNAPVASVQIANISKNKKKINDNTNEIFIIIATFYSNSSADFLKKRITTEINNFNSAKLKIKKMNNKEINLLSGPYKSVNSLKNDYIKLINFGFEELDIAINE